MRRPTAAPTSVDPLRRPTAAPPGVDPLRRPISWLLVTLVHLYQLTLSPLIGRQCKYHPTCSRYFIEAVIRKGALRGTAKGLWRLCRCNPFAPGGYDPVN